MTEREKFLEEAFVIDLESTGPEYKEAEVTEVGYSILEDDEWKMHSQLYKPYTPIDPKISAITNISNRMVEDKEHFDNCTEDLNKKLEEHIGEHGALVAHNINYDKRLLEYNYPEVDVNKYDWICTIRLARVAFNDVEEIESFGLGYLRYFLDLDVPDDMGFHRADGDSFITAKLLELILDFGESIGQIDPNESYKQQLLDWMEKPIIYKNMPFGKHKGTPLEEVPSSYMQWALANVDRLNPEDDNYDEDLVISIQRAFDIQD